MYENRVSFASPFTRPPPGTFALMASTLGASVVTMAVHGWTAIPLARSLMCVPSLVLHQFKFWTLFTYAFVELDPLNLLLYLGISLWMFGAPLERSWGTRRMLTYFFATGSGAAILMVLLSVAFPTVGAVPLHASFILGDAIILGWALSNWGQPVFFFILPMKAQHLLAITVAFPVLYLIMGEYAAVLPVFLALGIGYLFAGGRIRPSQLLYSIKTVWLEWQLRRKSKHLRVIVPDDGDDRKKTYLN